MEKGEEFFEEEDEITVFLTGDNKDDSLEERIMGAEYRAKNLPKFYNSWKNRYPEKIIIITVLNI